MPKAKVPKAAPPRAAETVKNTALMSGTMASAACPGGVKKTLPRKT
jgi:hypothetical protein